MRLRILLPASGFIVIAVASCGGDNSPSPVSAPGAETTAKTQTLEAGAAVLQNKEPVEALNAYMDGFHFYSGNMAGQMASSTFQQAWGRADSEAHQRKTRGPITSPSNAGRSIPAEYQVATKEAALSGQ